MQRMMDKNKREMTTTLQRKAKRKNGTCEQIYPSTVTHMERAVTAVKIVNRKKKATRMKLHSTIKWAAVQDTVESVNEK